MPDASQRQQASFTISPTTTDINLNSACQFIVDPPDTEVTWQITPRIGNIVDGIYTSPDKLKMPQPVTVIAISSAGHATAVVNIADVRKPILWLGTYAIALGAIVAIGILVAWNSLYKTDSKVQLIVNPALVTLDPGKDDNYDFTASVVGSGKDIVSWSVLGGGEIDSKGTFRQKLQPATVIDRDLTVVAHSTAFPSLSATAVIHLLSGKHFEIDPVPTAVFSSQQVSFKVPDASPQWSVSRSDIATISGDGLFRAETAGEAPAIVQITAWSSGHPLAAIALMIGTDANIASSGSAVLLVFVMLCGTLGSMIYFSSSFVSYVGNQTFRSSWTWFYISRPFVGGALALIFFFIVGSGLISGTSAGELMKIGMISALVGLFSDKAIKKLSDVLDVLLTTKDDRKDKVKEPTPPSSAASAPNTSKLPRISSVDPETIAPGFSGSITVRGINFGSKYEVKVNEDEVVPISSSDEAFSINITPLQAKAPKIIITVTTDEGTISRELKVE